MNPYPPQAEQDDFLEPAPDARAMVSLGSSDGRTLHHFLRLGLKYSWVILLFGLIGAALAVFHNRNSPNEYVATTNIEITQNTANQFRVDSGAGGDDDGYIDVTKLETETAVLQSATLALQTINSLHLEKNKDFLPLGNTHNFDVSNIRDRHFLIAIFSGSVKADRMGHTNILNVSCTSRSPRLAAVICNTLVDNYVQHNFADNYAATREVSVWLQAQLGDLRAKLATSQEQMLSVQRDIGLVGIDQTQSIVLSRLVDLDHNLTEAETQRLVAQARLITLQSAPVDVLPGLSNDAMLVSLKAHQSEIETEYAGQKVKYGPNNPRMTELHAQLDQLNQAIKLQEQNVISRAREEMNAAAENERALRTKLEQEKDEAYQGNSKAVQYTLARREYESNRSLYDALQQRLQEAGIIAGLHSSDIRKIDPADEPDGPSAPRRGQNIMMGLLGGLGFGLFLAIVIEAFDTNIKTISDIEERLGLPMLGVIPQVDAKQLSPQAFVDDATSTEPGTWSRLAEAYRSLRTTVLLSRPGAPPQVVLISSAKPSEGKTSVSTLESIVFALNGARVLLIDSDLRRPSVHLRFRIPNKVGLTSVLTGKSSFEESLVKLPSVPTLDILPSGPIAPMPAELLGSKQMRELVENARRHYDFVIIDTPPVLTVTDAAVLVSVSDGIVLVLRYGQSSRNVVARASEIMLRSGGHLLGVVLNAVDLQSSDYAEYYGRAYNDYYQSRVETEE